MFSQIEKFEENKKKVETQLANIEKKREYLISSISNYEYQIKVLKFDEIERIMGERLLSFDDTLNIIKASKNNDINNHEHVILEKETTE